MDIASKLNKMSIKEKFRAMESKWDDLCHTSDFTSPDWHKDILVRIRILKSAQEDLREGYWFYESQEGGVGAYFIDSFNSDIESLKIYAGVQKTAAQ